MYGHRINVRIEKRLYSLILYYNNSLIYKTVYNMATKTIDATLFASSTSRFIAKRTSVSGLLISLAMMVAGLLIFVSIFEMHDKSSTISMALMVVGTALILLGGIPFVLEVEGNGVPAYRKRDKGAQHVFRFEAYR